MIFKQYLGLIFKQYLGLIFGQYILFFDLHFFISIIFGHFAEGGGELDEKNSVLHYYTWCLTGFLNSWDGIFVWMGRERGGGYEWEERV